MILFLSQGFFNAICCFSVF